MTIQEIIVYLAVIAAFVVAGRHFWKTFFRKDAKSSCSGCTSDCSGCALEDLKKELEKRAKEKDQNPDITGGSRIAD